MSWDTYRCEWTGGIRHMGVSESDGSLWAPPWWIRMVTPAKAEQIEWTSPWKPWKIWMWQRYLRSRITGVVTLLE